MMRAVAIACGLVVIAANMPRHTDRLALVGIALSLPAIAAVACVRDRLRRWP